MEPEKEGTVAEITESQVLADIAAATGFDDLVHDPKAKTVLEMLESEDFRGLSERTVQRRMKKAVRQGSMERVKVLRRYEGGGQTRVVAYRLREQ